MNSWRSDADTELIVLLLISREMERSSGREECASLVSLLATTFVKRFVDGRLSVLTPRVISAKSFRSSRKKKTLSVSTRLYV